MKAKTSLELAMAMVEAVRDAQLDIPTIQLLDSIVTESGLSRNLIELRLLQQLAGRASKLRRDEWDDELTKKIWNTVVLAEKANNRPWAFPWLRGLLGQADALRHEAEVRLLPQSLGFVSARQLEESWEQAAHAYGFIDDMQSKLKSTGQP